MNEKFMKIAQKLALGSNGDIPVGAVIVKNDEIIAIASNETEKTNDVTAHAEIVAIKKASELLNNWRLDECELYVTLEPCPMCAGAIVAARLSRLVYGAPDARTGAVESIFNIPGHPSLHHTLLVTAGVMEEECRTLLKKFFEERRLETFLHCGDNPPML